MEGRSLAVMTFLFLLLLFFFPMLGNRFFTAARTFFCSAGVPF